MDQNFFQNNAAFQNLSPEKLQFIINFANMKKPTQLQAMVPFLLASMNRAQKENIQFTPTESDLLIEVLKQNMSPEEALKVDKVVKLMKQRRNG